jgi:uncharacterized protein (TIGR02271 family)
MGAKRVTTTNRQPAESKPQTSGEQLIIPVIEEGIAVGKKVVETGKVRISKRISEREELVDVPLLHENVSVERVPVNMYIEAPPPVRQEGDTMIIPVVEEQIVIQKRLVLVEELRVRKEVVQGHRPQTVSVRKEHVEIKRLTKNRKADRPSNG